MKNYKNWRSWFVVVLWSGFGTQLPSSPATSWYMQTILESSLIKGAYRRVGWLRSWWQLIAITLRSRISRPFREGKVSSGAKTKSAFRDKRDELTSNCADMAKQNAGLGLITPEVADMFVFTVAAECLIGKALRPELWLFPHPLIEIKNKQSPRRRIAVPEVTVSSSVVIPLPEVPTPVWVLTSDKCAPCLVEFDANTGRGIYLGSSSWPSKRVLIGGVYTLTSRTGA